MTSHDFGRRAGLLLAGVLTSLPIQASAQVIEIDPVVGVKTYDGPAVVHSDGSVAALGPARSPVRRALAQDREGQALRAEAAAAAALSPDLIEAVAWRESRLRRGQVSPKGAIGEMQLMPATASALGVDPYNSQQNYRGGAAYLRWLMRRYDGNLLWVLAAYDAGPRAVEKYHGAPPFKETQAYVAAVLDRLSQRATTLASNAAGRSNR